MPFEDMEVFVFKRPIIWSTNIALYNNINIIVSFGPFAKSLSGLTHLVTMDLFFP